MKIGIILNLYRESQKKMFMHLVGYGMKSMRPPISQRLILSIMRIFFLLSHTCLTPNKLEMSVMGLYWNPEFIVLFWSVIYEAIKFVASVSEIELSLR